MRPRTLDEFVGQEHILGEGRLLRRAITADLLSSIILYGPPGTGKTTLARVIANTTSSAFISINAVLSGVKEIRESIDQARSARDLYDRRTILFVDEVHRWNKAQQDALLPWVENGTVILIGATTQNPFFEVNSALVSRSRVFQLTPLNRDDMLKIAATAVSDPVRGYGRFDVRIEADALDHLIAVADGDARGLLGALQLAVETTPDAYPPPDGTLIRITREIAEESIQQRAVLYDKEGDYHYDAISAFIKSIRGSDPDAALYWMARMLHSGEHPHFVFRRMLISASEDIGMADPNALVVVESAAAAFDRVGLPEGNFFLTEAALYLATAPKSNSTLGYFDALDAVATEARREVPNHLRDSSRDAEGFGHGKGYLYPHAFRDHWVAQAYLPDALKGRVFYQPSGQGYEGAVATDVYRRRELQLEAIVSDEPDEVFSFTRSADRRLGEWVARAEQGRLAAIGTLRDKVTEHARIARHHRVLVVGRSASLHVWESVRRAPEGRVVAWIRDERRAQMIHHYTEQLSELERPLIVTSDRLDLPEAFERIIAADALLTAEDRAAAPELLRAHADGNARLVVIQRFPAGGTRLSDTVGESCPADVREPLLAAEQWIYGPNGNATVNWSETDLADALVASGWHVAPADTIDTDEARRFDAAAIARWFDPKTAGSLGATIATLSDDATRERVERWIAAALIDSVMPWSTRYLLITAGPVRS
ncbi:MAG: AAA family ATPase [Spirochaetaceae bacterium]|nr:MAG: AAA family ATPase [Spirochaetaceae bacterium]